MATQQPIVLCMDNSLGEEVAVRVEPEDDFQSFLDKAKGLLGLEVDINLITGNQHVSLTENMYQFLLKAEQNMHSMQFDQMLEPNPDSVYVLDDGTQIRASQIQFDNDDPVDFAIGNIPFVKYTNDVDSDVEDVVVEKTVDYNIIDSPVAKRPDHTSSPQSFANSLPFKLVCTNTTAFENQFAKYVETKTYATLNNVTNRNKSPRSLIRDNYTKYDDSHQRKTDNCSCTREEILNMFKDSPVNSLPYEGYSERRHVRKSDPSRIHKSFKPLVADLDGVLISENGNQICFICDRKVDREKIYLFDNEDQKIHRKSPQKKTETQLKIICEKCLSENFTPCSMKGANQFLNPDEYLVIRNNQQYIFKKIKNIDFKTISRGKRNESKKIASEEFVKVEIGSDGEIITKPIDEKSDDVIVVRDRDSSSDVEIIEPEAEIDTIINNLEDADEQVKEFLGKYQCDGSNEVELKCRFCEHIFSNISEVIEHGEVHKQDVDDDPVFPCPLCNYGYAHFKWLKGHLMAAHEKKSDDVKKEVADSDKKGTEDLNQTTVEVKCEAITEENPASSDDEIWIVQTADADVEGTDQLQKLLDAANVVEKQDESKKTPKCLNCSQIFPSLEALATHRCRRRGRKRKSGNDSTTICVPTQQDFIKRAQGRPRQTNVNGDNSIIPKPRKKKSKEPSSDPQIVTCDNCNESFTSKVRLKFHMQFHESTPMLSEGRYRCVECAGAVFGTETALFDHVHFQHDKLKRWQCPVHGCGKTFHLRATLTKHSRTHTDTRRYVCVTCGKRFLDKQTLDEHGVTHLQIKPFQCHICLKQLTRRSRLRMHVRAHEEELAPRRVLVCAVCRRAFRDAQHAQEHATKSTECIEAFANDLKVESDEATVQLSPTSGIVRHTVQILESPKLSKPIPRQVDSPLAQPLLSQVTDEGRSIIRVVEIEKAFRCEYCEDVFYLEDSLNSHRAIHKGVRNPFTCHICKVSFATYSRVTTHKTTHGFYKRSLASAQQASQVGVQGSQGPAATGILGYGDFPVVKHFLCEDCGRSYLHWTYLQVHRRMKHANENYTYACNQCELTFPNSSSVGYHRKKVHGKTGPDDPPAASSKEPRANYRIPCRDCDEVLPSKTALYKHRKKEHCNISCRPGIFCCGTCGKQYGSRAGLEAHLLTHSGNAYDKYGAGHSIEGSRQFRGGGGGGAWRCPWCGARCATRAQLRTHLRHAHTATRAVIEIEGWNPTPEDITRVLAANNISQDKVVEITKISFSKGTSSIVPDCPRALALLSDVPRTQIACGRPPEQTAVPYPTVDEFQSLAHNRLMSKNLRRPKILQRGGDERPQPEPSYPLSVSVTGEELSDLSMQLLLRDGVLVDGSQMVQLHRNDSMLLE